MKGTGNLSIYLYLYLYLYIHIYIYTYIDLYANMRVSFHALVCMRVSFHGDVNRPRLKKNQSKE